MMCPFRLHAKDVALLLDDEVAKIVGFQESVFLT